MNKMKVYFIINRYWIIRFVSQSEMMDEVKKNKKKQDGNETTTTTDDDEVDNDFPSQDRNHDLHLFYCNGMNATTSVDEEEEKPIRKNKYNAFLEVDLTAEETPTPMKKMKMNALNKK